MIACDKFFNIFKDSEIEFFTGVPDSLLKDFCAYIEDNSNNHIIAANEGGAIALAAGYYLATGKIPVVYMQNAGQGNAVNPLASLTDNNVYSTPMLLIIGWRGNPEDKDEPQHIRQGMITKKLLDLLEIPYQILSDNIIEAKNCVEAAIKFMKEETLPYAIIVRKNTFEKYEKKFVDTGYKLTREEAIKIVVDELDEKDIIISTTGKTSRELFEYREERNEKHEKDFLNIGAMGHTSQIALGIALSKPNKKIYCLDGDGAVIMHMGALAIIGAQSPENFKHIILNNGCHESVGGQPTAGFKIDFTSIAKACGYKKVFSAKTSKDIKEKMKLLKSCNGPALLEIKINNLSKKELGRPTINPKDMKKSFMEFLVK